jgi:hypothetical protein
MLFCLTNKWRFYHNTAFTILACVFGFAASFLPAVCLAVYAGGIYKTIRNSVARSSSVVFWLYWPCCRFLACMVAVGLAWTVGNNIWYNQWQLYYEYAHLQAYDNVDTYSVTGNRMQDAGLVVFNETNGVDRARGSCLVSDHIYCIAPIVRGGQLNRLDKQNRVGINDVFMAGIDCCSCPMTDFRCGDYADPHTPIGGMRLLNEESRKLFRVAMQKWSVDWDKKTTHGIFFNWVNDPVAKWKELWAHGWNLWQLAVIFGLFAPFLFNVIMNGLMKVLREFQIAAPLDDYYGDNPTISLYGSSYGPYGPNGLHGPIPGPETKSFVPEEYRDYLNQREPDQYDFEPKYVIL